MSINLFLCKLFKTTYKRWLNENDVVISVKGINKAVVEDPLGNRWTATIGLKTRVVSKYNLEKKVEIYLTFPLRSSIIQQRRTIWTDQKRSFRDLTKKAGRLFRPGRKGF